MPALERSRISTLRRFGYALGNAGFQLTDRIVVLTAIYFYLPPAESDLVPQLPPQLLGGVLSAYGLARLIGGLFDSLADPLVGWASDRSRAALGRRRFYMLCGLLPMTLLPPLLFWPPAPAGSTLNLLSLSLLLAAFYVFFTVYVGPYLALIPEIAPSQSERVRLASLMSACALPVMGYGAAWLAGVGLGRALGLGTADSIRAVVVLASFTALLLCLLPVLAVDEARLLRSTPASLPLGTALRRTLADRGFQLYLASQVLLLLGVNLLQPALPYYAVVVLGRSEAWGAWLGVAYLPGLALGLLGMRRLVDRFGAKRSLLACIAVLVLCQLLLGLLRPALPGAAGDLRNQLIVFTALALAGLPVAGYLVLPHVLISQLIDADAGRSGSPRAAMFYGVQGLLTKWVHGASAALLSFLLLHFGHSRAAADGVLLVGPVAALLCAGSLLILLFYPERRLLAERSAAGSRAGPA